MFNSISKKSVQNNSSITERNGGNANSLPAVSVQQNKPIQKIEIEEEEPIQAKSIIQKKDIEEEEPVQAKSIIQRIEIEEEEPIQAKAIVQKKANQTGLPDQLKEGVENLSGMGMDDVKVHYNSDKPAQLQALAYAQGTDIHVGPGQEKHLPHEAWHVVQQKQGRVQPTTQMKGGVAVNDDKGLENEADVMGAASFRISANQSLPVQQNKNIGSEKISFSKTEIVQRTVDSDLDEGTEAVSATLNYQGNVMDIVSSYVEKIHGITVVGDSNYDDFANQMAGGYKVWANNYYNKSQAYLYEAQKAAQYTQFGANNRNNFAVLGVDTDENADIELISEKFEKNKETGDLNKLPLEQTAIEFKASTSPNFDTVDKLFIKGMAQLHKRENLNKFKFLKLEIHNDNKNNYWPITDAKFKSQFGSNIVNITGADYQARLEQRVSASINSNDIKLPIEVVAEHNSTAYAATKNN
ncbi:DUF4157 domain-containing protein [Pedobacter sp. L105]|uniref:eCIS core domain-containing protein n=1 Tax=Pedobacter sp. L105 TaxID=1641871 RepID=UPI00131BF51E|nr:DUF4157 domain-containing protein [Pedobacter sp. L105]